MLPDMKHEFVLLASWLVAIVATLLLLPDRSVFTKLGPVYAICMIGSVVSARRSRR